MGRLCYLVGRDESDDKSDDFDSFTECGRTACECRRRVTCAWTTPGGSRLGIGMSQETVTGRFPSLLLGRRRPPRRLRSVAGGGRVVLACG
ncbi:hypothetical protein EVAR_86868_1 [Eumeta japonica]|uniref:Uncharacterized protein n=1 Tax=Eumeta variegata TaxID=151549 RepID=A0A4C1VVL9_EUMVA|nr:hypothetical protein EVAR_86868_1 [Eumeta japonica]